MRILRFPCVLAVIAAGLALGGCGGGGHTETQSAPPVLGGVDHGAGMGAFGGGPRAKDDAATLRLNGKWTMTQEGSQLIGHKSVPLVLEVEGSHVLGHYHPDQGTIDGQLRGDVIEGSWKESDGEGNFVWKISSDGTHFTGVFTGMLHSQHVPEGATWSGVKR